MHYSWVFVLSAKCGVDPRIQTTIGSCSPSQICFIIWRRNCVFVESKISSSDNKENEMHEPNVTWIRGSTPHFKKTGSECSRDFRLMNSIFDTITHYIISLKLVQPRHFHVFVVCKIQEKLACVGNGVLRCFMFICHKVRFPLGTVLVRLFYCVIHTVCNVHAWTDNPIAFGVPLRQKVRFTRQCFLTALYHWWSGHPPNADRDRGLCGGQGNLFRFNERCGVLHK